MKWHYWHFLGIGYAKPVMFNNFIKKKMKKIHQWQIQKLIVHPLVAEAGEGLVGKGDDGSGWNAPFWVFTIAVDVAFHRTNSNETTEDASMPFV